MKYFKRIVISLISLFLALAASPALAKTEGNYFELSYIHSDLMTHFIHDDSLTSRKYHDRSNSFGLRYGYAFNHNKFFLMPSLYYDHNNVVINEIDEDQVLPGGVVNANLKGVYGIKVDFGYDINNKFSVFVNTSFGMARYAAGYHAHNYSQREDYNSETFGTGIGARYILNDDLSISASYEIYDMSSGNIADPVVNKDRFRFNSVDDLFPPELIIGRIAFSYNF